MPDATTQQDTSACTTTILPAILSTTPDFFVVASECLFMCFIACLMEFSRRTNTFVRSLTPPATLGSRRFRK
jgi:hypothetical protein